MSSAVEATADHETLTGYLVCSRYADVWHLMNIAVAPEARVSGEVAASVAGSFSEPPQLMKDNEVQYAICWSGRVVGDPAFGLSFEGGKAAHAETTLGTLHCLSTSSYDFDGDTAHEREVALGVDLGDTDPLRALGDLDHVAGRDVDRPQLGEGAAFQTAADGSPLHDVDAAELILLQGCLERLRRGQVRLCLAALRVEAVQRSARCG